MTKTLYTDKLPVSTNDTLQQISKQQWLKDSGWYLSGGTALALQAGHRKSYDLDFFYPLKSFNQNQLLVNLENIGDWSTTVNEPATVYGLLLNTKVSFIAYPFFIPKQEPIYYGSVKIIDALDVAVMKIIAISQRGRKRDFYDLFWCAKNLAPLEELIGKLPNQYPNLAHNYNRILTSLVYFADAESDPEPETYFEVAWEDIKRFFIQEVPKIGDRVLKLGN